jgi:predicted small secreted protein
MKKPLVFVALVILLSSLSACNTIHGMGKDIKKAGEKIEDASKS